MYIYLKTGIYKTLLSNKLCSFQIMMMKILTFKTKEKNIEGSKLRILLRVIAILDIGQLLGKRTKPCIPNVTDMPTMK